MTARAILVSVRFTSTEIEQLKSRAYSVSGSVTGIARELVRAGLAGGDFKAIGERLGQMERRLATVEQQGREIHTRTLANERGIKDLLGMFDELLKTLTRGSAT